MLILILLFAAFILFVISISGRINLIAAGLACWVLAELLPHLHLG